MAAVSVLASLSHPGSPYGTSYSVVTKSGGDIFVICINTSNDLLVYKSTNGGTSFTLVKTIDQVTDLGEAVSASSYHCDAAMDTAGYIHIAWAINTNSNTYEVYYIYYNTATDTFTYDGVVGQTKYNNTYTHEVAICVDSNNKPHMIYTFIEANMGTDYNRVYYANKTGASWSTPEMVSTGTQKNYAGLSIISYGTADVLCHYTNYTDTVATYRGRISGTWGTEMTNGTSSRAIGLVKAGTGSAAYFWVLTTSVESTVNQVTTTDPVTGSISPKSANTDNTDYWAFYTDASGSDIYYKKRTGSTWGTETMLESTGIGTKLYVEYAKNAEYQSSRINYLFASSSTLYFNYLSTATGTQYNQSVSGAIANTSLTGALARRPGKALSGAISNANLAGTVNKFISRKNLAGTLTSAGTLAKRMYAALAGAINSAGTLVTSKVALKFFTNNFLNPIGDVSKRTTKSFAGAAGSAGTLAKLTVKSMAGAVNSAGSIIKQTWKVIYKTDGWSLVGPERLVYVFGSPDGDTPFGAKVIVQKLIVRLFTGALTSAGTVAKSTTKSFAGAVTSAGALAKRMYVAIAGAVTSAGNIIKQTWKVIYRNDVYSLAGPERIVHTFGSPDGDTVFGAKVIVQKRAARLFTGAITSAGTVAKLTAKSMAGAINSSGTLNRIRTFVRSVSGAITSSGTVLRNAIYSRYFTNNLLNPTGSLARRVGKALAGAVTSSGTVSAFRRFVRAITGTLTSAGSIAKRTSKRATGTLTSSGATIKRIYKTLAGAVTSAGWALAQGTSSKIQIFMQYYRRMRGG